MSMYGTRTCTVGIYVRVHVKSQPRTGRARARGPVLFCSVLIARTGPDTPHALVTGRSGSARTGHVLVCFCKCGCGTWTCTDLYSTRHDRMYRSENLTFTFETASPHGTHTPHTRAQRHRHDGRLTVTFTVALRSSTQHHGTVRWYGTPHSTQYLTVLSTTRQSLKEDTTCYIHALECAVIKQGLSLIRDVPCRRRRCT